MNKFRGFKIKNSLSTKDQRKSIFLFLNSTLKSGDWTNLLDLQWSWDPAWRIRSESIVSPFFILGVYGFIQKMTKKIVLLCSLELHLHLIFVCFWEEMGQKQKKKSRIAVRPIDKDITKTTERWQWGRIRILHLKTESKREAIFLLIQFNKIFFKIFSYISILNLINRGFY